MEILLALIVSALITILIVSLAIIFLYYKNKCKHQWEEVKRLGLVSKNGIEYTQIELKCKLCGDIKIVEF